MSRGTKAALIAGTVLCTLATLPTAAQAAPAADSPPSKSHWLRDVAPVAADLHHYLEQRLAQVPSGEKPAVVLDIDNTSLATYYDEGNPVEAVLDAAEYAHAHGAAVLFASYRDADSRRSTTEQLTSAGYTSTGSASSLADTAPARPR
ncbi:hypothetical protein [Streptomyces kronopolitis]|nr:hypothetical protein [Streptomyces kronopolitis]